MRDRDRKPGAGREARREGPNYCTGPRMSALISINPNNLLLVQLVLFRIKFQCSLKDC